MFHLDVAYVCNGFKCFSGIFASVSSVFFCMLQLLYLDILKVDQVLHMGCGRWRGRCPGRREITTDVLPHEPDVLGACLLPNAARTGSEQAPGASIQIVCHFIRVMVRSDKNKDAAPHLMI
jgi:hypothetical protein